MHNRRQFLLHMARASGLVLTPGAVAWAAASVDTSARGRALLRSFEGRHPGQERVIDGVVLCWCPPGSFVMGSPVTEKGHRPDEAQVDVRLTRGYWIGKVEVTQAQWQRVVGAYPDKTPSAEFGAGNELPVYWLNFHDAELFCANLTRRAHASKDLPAGWEFRLPTEAQWEYACRAGTVTATAFGDDLTLRHANFTGVWENPDRRARRVGRARAVGSYPANAWGIHDMHGNVWEWCRDWYHARLPGGTDPDLYDDVGVANRDQTFSRVRRGGAWTDDGWACRSACRIRFEPPRRSDHIGFRVVAVAR